MLEQIPVISSYFTPSSVQKEIRYLEQTRSFPEKIVTKFCLNSVAAAAAQLHSQTLSESKMPFKDQIPGNRQLER